MDDRYDHRIIEEKWSRQWQEDKAFATDLEGARRPYYNLMMFPYPSAEGLHMGNVFSYVGSDIHGRFRRTQGYQVFQPMGFDAFGIHSENYALKKGRHPAELIPENVRRFRAQLERLGAIFDWDHQVNTTDPSYYRWTQWILVQLFRRGLMYRRQAPVHWCPSCRTVLAAEQAAGGTCERCDSAVEERQMPQWFLRITAYAQRLLDNLEWIDWSEITRNAQRTWIGRSAGAKIRFVVEGTDAKIEVFTTRPDTLWGATYLVLAPGHSLVERLASGRPELAACQGQARQPEAGQAKSGAFTGVHAVHPATGQKLPIWVADYVLMEYGTGAIMGVPAHDQRDFEFARQCGLPVVEVIVPQGGTGGLERAYEGEGELVNSGPFTGLYSQEARERIGAWLEERGAGQRAVQYRLRDWCISRQRYWGPPIPIIYCPACGPVAVPEEELPVVLPFVADFAPDGSGKSPLARCPQFARSRCAQCGREAPRETDVSDNFLDSAWYFFRYPSAGHGQAIFDPRLTRQWLPVDMYIGGNEHAVLHLMYARFLTMAFKDMGLIHFEEPFKKFRANGMIVKDGAKMSKSRGNVVNPDEYLDRYGADALRMYLMFSGNFQEGGDFRQEGLSGVRRFLERLWRYAAQTRFAEGTIEDRQVLRRVHGAIHKVTQDLEELHYNTAVPALMELLSFLQEGERHYREAVRLLLQLTAPFAPFITQELWERLGEPGRLCDAPWPQSSEELRRAGLVEWVVQVNGRVRDRVELERDAPREQVEKIVFARPRVRTWIEGKEVVKVVFVPNRLVSIAAKGPPGA